MDTLTRTRQQLDTLLAAIRSDIDAAAANRAADLDRREAELARSMELVSQDAAVAAAWRECQAEQRRWFQSLITLQLQHLAHNSPTRTVLHHLSRMVEQTNA